MNIAEATARRLYTDGRKREARNHRCRWHDTYFGSAARCSRCSFLRTHFFQDRRSLRQIIRACPLYAFILIGNGPSALFLTPTFQQSFQFSPRTPRPTLTAHHCQPTSRQRCEKLLRARNKPMPRSCQDLKRHSERGRSTSVKLRGDPDLRPRGLRLGNRNLDGLA